MVIQRWRAPIGTVPIPATTPGEPASPEIEDRVERGSLLAHKAKAAGTLALWRGATAGLGAAFGAPGVVAGAVGSGILAAVLEENPGRKLSTGAATAAVQSAWGLTGVLFGLQGAVMAAGAGALEGFRADDARLSSRTVKLPGAHQPQAAHATTHLITVVDATESISAPYASQYLQQLEEAKAQAGDSFEADVRLERTSEPFLKLFAGAIWTTTLVACGAVCGPGWLGASVAAGLLTLNRSRTTGHLASGAADLTLPLWSGRRNYAVAPDSTRGFDSIPTTSEPFQEKRDVAEITDFLKASMAKYPAALKVVHLAGHGLGYRFSAGLSYDHFQQVVDTLSEEGPVDVLVLDSCLEGNLETLARLPDAARYVVVSEENVPIGDVPETLKAALQEIDGKPVDGLTFGAAMIRNARSDSENVPDTLALVDTSRVPALLDSVDRLGAALAQEVREGGGEWLKPVLKKTARLPGSGWMVRKLVGLGDLKQLAEGVKQQRGQDAIGEAAQAVLDSLEQTVVARHTSADYSDTGGVSVQLPGAKAERWSGLLPHHPFAKSEAPEGWKQFVRAWENR